MTKEAVEGDRCVKIRPVIEKLNDFFMTYRRAEKKADVDASMVPYFSCYEASINQSMCQKLIRFGCEVWCLNYPSG